MNGILICFGWKINGLLHKHLSSNFSCKCIHAEEPLSSNSAVIAGWLQTTRAQNIFVWFTVIHSLRKFFKAINFHDDFFFHLK